MFTIKNIIPTDWYRCKKKNIN